jgi:4-methylaminobutanoate oxidase (formaldehyde-forming)
MQRVCGNNVDAPVGKTIYTGMFNKRGGFESDCTLLRSRADQFVLITGTSQPKRDMDWIQRNKSDSEEVELTDITAQYSVIGLMGPGSRTVLQKLTDANLENGAFPFGTFREIGIGYATVRAVRITYVGELGWELHAPVHQALHVYNCLMAAGADYGIANAGHYAINSLRLEKGYRAWGAELSPDDSPLEAGLSFAIDWNKEFIGKEALQKQKEKPLSRKLFTFVLRDPEQALWGSEPIYLDGQPVGYTSSGSYGHSVGGAVGMGYIKGDFDWKQIASRKLEIGVNGKRMAAAAYLKPPYDSERKRILA